MSSTATAQHVLSTLIEAYEGPASGAPADGPVFGFVGQDVPVELIEAAGVRPLRLRGNPGWDRTDAERYLGTGVDPAITSILAGILSGAFGKLDAIIISSDCDASQRLFYVLREMRRVEPMAGIPRVHLVDVLHLPRESTTRYNRVRIQEFIDRLREWTQAPIGDEAVSNAIAEGNKVRELQRQVMSLRHENPSRLTGTESLAVMGARTRMPRDHYTTLLQQLLTSAHGLPKHDGVRVFLTGSNHDSAVVYQELEQKGVVVVSEDHDWGELSITRDIAGDTLADLVLRYRDNGPTPQRATVAERAAHTAATAAATQADVVLSYSRLKDEAPLWDVPMQRAESPVRFATILRQPYGEVDSEAVAKVLASAGDKWEDVS